LAAQNLTALAASGGPPEGAAEATAEGGQSSELVRD